MFVVPTSGSSPGEVQVIKVSARDFAAVPNSLEFG